MIFSKKYFIAQWGLRVTLAMVTKSTQDFFMSRNLLLPHNASHSMSCSRRMRVLIQARGILCEVRTERNVDLLVFKALMSLAPPF